MTTSSSSEYVSVLTTKYLYIFAKNKRALCMQLENVDMQSFSFINYNFPDYITVEKQACIGLLQINNHILQLIFTIENVQNYQLQIAYADIVYCVTQEQDCLFIVETQSLDNFLIIHYIDKQLQQQFVVFNMFCQRRQFTLTFVGSTSQDNHYDFSITNDTVIKQLSQKVKVINGRYYGSKNFIKSTDMHIKYIHRRFDQISKLSLNKHILIDQIQHQIFAEINNQFKQTNSIKNPTLYSVQVKEGTYFFEDKQNNQQFRILSERQGSQLLQYEIFTTHYENMSSDTLLQYVYSDENTQTQYFLNYAYKNSKHIANAHHTVFMLTSTDLYQIQLYEINAVQKLIDSVIEQNKQQFYETFQELQQDFIDQQYLLQNNTFMVTEFKEKEISIILQFMFTPNTTLFLKWKCIEYIRELAKQNSYAPITKLQLLHFLLIQLNTSLGQELISKHYASYIGVIIAIIKVLQAEFPKKLVRDNQEVQQLYSHVFEIINFILIKQSIRNCVSKDSNAGLITFNEYLDKYKIQQTPIAQYLKITLYQYIDIKIVPDVKIALENIRIKVLYPQNYNIDLDTQIHNTIFMVALPNLVQLEQISNIQGLDLLKYQFNINTIIQLLEYTQHHTCSAFQEGIIQHKSKNNIEYELQYTYYSIKVSRKEYSKDQILRHIQYIFINISHFLYKQSENILQIGLFINLVNKYTQQTNIFQFDEIHQLSDYYMFRNIMSNQEITQQQILTLQKYYNVSISDVEQCNIEQFTQLPCVEQLIILNCFTLEYYTRVSPMLKNKLKQNFNYLKEYVSILFGIDTNDEIILLLIQVLNNINMQIGNQIARYILNNIPVHYSKHDLQLYQVLQTLLDNNNKDMFKIIEVMHQLQVPISPNSILNGLDNESMDHIAEFLATDEHIQKLEDIQKYINDQSNGWKLLNKVVAKVIMNDDTKQYVVQYLMRTSPECFILTFLNQLLQYKDIPQTLINLQQQIIFQKLQFLDNQKIQAFINIVRLNQELQVASIFPQIVLLAMSQYDSQTQQYFKILATQFGFTELLALIQNSCPQYVIEKALYFTYYNEKYSNRNFEIFFADIVKLLQIYKQQKIGQTIMFLLYQFFKQNKLSKSELTQFLTQNQINHQSLFQISLAELIKIYENDQELQQQIIFNINFIFDNTDKQNVKITCMFILSILGIRRNSQVDTQQSIDLGFSEQQSATNWENSIASPMGNISTVYIPQFNDKVIMQIFTDTQSDIIAKLKSLYVKNNTQKLSASGKFQINYMFETVIQEVKEDNYDGFYQLLLYYFLKTQMQRKDVQLDYTDKYHNVVLCYIFSLNNTHQIQSFSTIYITNLITACKVKKVNDLFDGQYIANIIQNQKNNIEFFIKLTASTNKYIDICTNLNYLQEQLSGFVVNIQTIFDGTFTIDIELLTQQQNNHFISIEKKIKYLDCIHIIATYLQLTTEQQKAIYNNVIQIILGKGTCKYQCHEDIPQYIILYYQQLFEFQQTTKSAFNDLSTNLNLSSGQSSNKSQQISQTGIQSSTQQDKMKQSTVPSGWDQFSSSSEGSQDDQKQTVSQNTQNSKQQAQRSGWDVYSSDEDSDYEKAESVQQSNVNKIQSVGPEQLRLSQNTMEQQISVSQKDIEDKIQQIRSQSKILFNQCDMRLELQIFLIYIIDIFNIDLPSDQLVKLNLHLALMLHLVKSQNDHETVMEQYIHHLISTKPKHNYKQILLELQNIKDYLSFYPSNFININVSSDNLQHLTQKFMNYIVNDKNKYENMLDFILDNLDFINVDQISNQSLKEIIFKFKKWKSKKFKSSNFYKTLDQATTLKYSIQNILTKLDPEINQSIQVEVLQQYIQTNLSNNKKPKIHVDELVKMIDDKQFYNHQIYGELFVYLYDIVTQNSTQELLLQLKNKSPVVVAQVIGYCLIINNALSSEVNELLNSSIQQLLDKSYSKYYFTDDNKWFIIHQYDEQENETRYAFPAQIAKWISLEQFITVIYARVGVPRKVYCADKLGGRVGTQRLVIEFRKQRKTKHANQDAQKDNCVLTQMSEHAIHFLMPKNDLFSQIKLRKIDRSDTAGEVGVYLQSEQKHDVSSEKIQSPQEPLKAGVQTQSPSAKSSSVRKGIMSFVTKKENVQMPQQRYNKKFQQEDIFMQTREYNKKYKSFADMLEKPAKNGHKLSFIQKCNFENDYKENLVNLLINNEIDNRQADATRMMIIGHFETLEQLLYPAKQKSDGFAVNQNADPIKENLNEMRNKNIIKFGQHIKKTLGDSLDNPNVQDKVREDLGFNSGLASIYVQSRVFFGYIPDPPLNSNNIYVNPLTIEDKIDYEEATQGFDVESETESSDESSSEDDSSDNSDSNDYNQITDNQLLQGDKLEDDLDDNQDDEEFADEKEFQMQRLVPIKRQKVLFKVLRKKQHNFTYPIPSLCPEGLSGVKEHFIVFDLRKPRRQLATREKNLVKTDDDVAEVIMNAYDDAYDGEQTQNGNVITYTNATLNKFYEPIILDSYDLQNCDRYEEAERTVLEIEEDEGVL